MALTHRVFDADDLRALLELNRLRAEGPREALERLERRFAAEFDADTHQAVYGTLAPGCPNHPQVSQLAGEWHIGYSVTGRLVRSGWAADAGYPALAWSPTGGNVPVQLLVSVELPRQWERLDEFEGPDYLRILVPVHAGGGVATVANLYAARTAPAA
jgi:gamma-glutamylcyclotransferase (GGCT)/AIG2-like uncharacterized protein YtfP